MNTKYQTVAGPSPGPRGSPCAALGLGRAGYRVVFRIYIVYVCISRIYKCVDIVLVYVFIKVQKLKKSVTLVRASRLIIIIFICVCVILCLHLYDHIYVCILKCVHMCMYIYIHIYIYVYIYI